MNETGQTPQHRSQAVEIAIVWLIVGIPFAYGVYNSLRAAANLFAG